MKDIKTTEEFNELKALKTKTAFKFTAGFCAPCKTIQPALEEINNKSNGDFEIVTVDVESASELAEEFGIRSVPTFIITQNDEIKEKFSGADIGKVKTALGI